MTHKITDQQIETAIVDSAGIVAHIAKALGVTRTTIYARLKASEALAELLGEEREATLDLAEMRLLEMIKSPKDEVAGPAVRFYLRTMGKHRGYSTRLELDGQLHHTGGVKIYLPSNGRDDAVPATADADAGPWPGVPGPQ